MTRRFMVPGLFGSGLVLVVAAAVLWVRSGPSSEPQAGALAGAAPTEVARSVSDSSPTAHPAPTSAPMPTAALTPTTVLTPKETLVQSAPARAPYDVGKALFVAKGCISCHWHDQAGVPASQSYKVGPDLTSIESVPYGGLPNDADFLRKWLKAPQALKPGTQMPTLGLADREIEDLLAFLLAS